MPNTIGLLEASPREPTILFPLMVGKRGYSLRLETNSRTLQDPKYPALQTGDLKFLDCQRRTQILVKKSSIIGLGQPASYRICVLLIRIAAFPRISVLEDCRIGFGDD
jgi:hypothetical protein